ncbi:MAG: hypothetical protein ACPGVU_02495 [Limisphaerales bacterium]
MIQLHSHSLVFETSDGELIPCDAEEVTIELIGEAVQNLDPNLVRQAATAVLHYFKNDLNQDVVTIREFTYALQQVLQNLGVDVTTDEKEVKKSQLKNGKILEADLNDLVEEDGSATELIFFKRLEREFGKLLSQSPRVVRLSGLKRCVKHLIGAQRWSKKCIETSDQIVTFLRECLDQHDSSLDCALLVH